jgi:hypothetical protein
VKASGFEIGHMRSSGLVHDDEYTRTIHSFSEVRTHDIVIFQPNDGRTDTRFSHPAVALIDSGRLYVAHNSRENGRAIIETVESSEQGRIVTIKRPIARPHRPDVQFLTRAGLQPFSIQ